MKISIRVKLIIGFSIIIFLFVGVIFLNHIIIINANNDLAHIKNMVNKQVEYSNSIKTDVIEVQQFLTDGSLTKFAGSMQEAENYKNKFKNSTKALGQLNNSLGTMISKMDGDFDSYYSLGLEMANTYINEGAVKGNVLMIRFDPMAENINSQVNRLVELSNQSMESDLNKISGQLKGAQTVGILVGLITFFLAIFIIIILERKITTSVKKMLLILTDMESGQGDLTKRIVINTTDEIGLMAGKFNKLMATLESMIFNIKKNIIVVNNSSEILNKGTIKTNEGIGFINGNMHKVIKDSDNISSVISDITCSISNIAKASMVTANDAQEISSTAGEINSIAIKSGKMAMNAKLEMLELEKISSETISLTEKLGSEAKEIGKIIDTIKAITDQTNLLALNAAIEAARAGEHGRGFGIVAEEIRKLAEGNNQSAHTIENLIKNIQELIAKTIYSTNNSGQNIKQGSQIVDDVNYQLNLITSVISTINEKIQNIAASTQEQSATTEELSATMETINSSNSQISTAVNEVAASISEQVDTSKALYAIASELNNSSEQLNIMVNKFKVHE